MGGRRKLNAEDYGRWTTSVYKIGDDSRTAIAYSQPLILPDGTIYGVVGVELLTSYLQTKLPYSELQDGNTGTYFLVSTTADEKDTSFIVSKAGHFQRGCDRFGSTGRHDELRTPGGRVLADATE